MSISAFVILFLLASTDIWVRGQEEADKCGPQLAEMKMMIAALTSKMSALDNKMSELNFLEYAFKVNSVDNHLTTIKQSVSNIEARMTRMDTQAEIIKDMLSSLSDSEGPCAASDTGKVREPVAHGSQRAGGEDPRCKEMAVKIEDYGYKLSKSQQELKDNGQRTQQTLGILMETVRNGFTKTFQKVDILPNMERQLSRMYASISGLSTQLPQALEGLTNVSQRVLVVQSEVTKVAQSISEGTSNSNKNVVSASLIHAMEFGNTVKSDLEKLTQVEPDIESARKMAKNLLTGQDPRRPTSIETLTNLTRILEKIETATAYLVPSLTSNFEGLHELLEIELSPISRNQSTVCNFRNVFKVEMKAIKDSINERGKGNNCLAESPDVAKGPPRNGEGVQDVSSAMKQKEVLDNLSYIRSTAMLIKSNLQGFFRQCADGTVPTVKPLGLIIG